MIRIFGLMLFFTLVSFAYDTTEIVNNYKDENFQEVCFMDKEVMDTIRDEEILSLIADACLKIDSINPLGSIIKRLISTPEYRENATYYATIVLQKKLLYQFMNDNIDISNIRLPRTEYILSVVFENLVKKNYKIVNTSNKTIEIKVGDKKYILWLSKDKQSKVFIEEYENSRFIKKRWYL